MSNLRIVSVKVVSSTSIEVTFTDTLTSNLVASNVSITADTINVPDSTVNEVSISGNVLTVTCQPLTQLAAYFIKFKSTAQHPFTSINGDAKLLEDGVSNQYLFTGPLAPDNPVRNFLGAFYHDNLYNIDDDQTIVNKYIQSLSVQMARALYDIRQLRNENYLSITIADEQQFRGAGPSDRVNEEAAYEIVRVGRKQVPTLLTL